VVLGDMAELGPAAVALHREVVDHALHRGLDLVVVAGPLYAEAAPTDHSGVLVVIEHIDVAAILNVLEKRTRAGDVILLKGSRSAGLERVLDAMAAHWSGTISNGEPMA
jgi:UDP-N-acetylmuramoyl-tripeptide--D-alanyl-D-alanine ligase